MSERQMGRSLIDIAPDHVARYMWAAKYLREWSIENDRTISSVLDIACGTGYGAHILGMYGYQVDCVDHSEDAMAHFNQFFKFDEEDVDFKLSDAIEYDCSGYDAIVSFETVEHIEDARKFCQKLLAPLVIVSSPNQDVLPFDPDKFKYHVKHYTKSELSDLIAHDNARWFSQHGKWKDFEVVPGDDGRILIMAAENHGIG